MVDHVRHPDATLGSNPPDMARDERAVSLPLWRELFVGIDWLSLRSSPVFYGFGVPRGDRSAVVLVPGFLGTDSYLRELHCWLQRIGYRPYMSRIGRNAECLDLLMDRLLVTIEAAARDTDGRVHLVGHSLGGILSRAAATRRPDLVASVITLGSPFRGIRSHPLVLAASRRVRARIASEGQTRDPRACYTGYCTCPTVTAWGQPLPSSVSQLAIYTRSDGIVDWRFCLTGDRAADAEVLGTHVGLAFNPFVFSRIAAHLALVARGAAAASQPVSTANQS
jgi:pimeloyl-ACP methyl ester carboxylesterase